jgi:hypothetical protein
MRSKVHFLRNDTVKQKKAQRNNHDNSDDKEEEISSVIRIIELESSCVLMLRKIIFVNLKHTLPQAFLFPVG